MFEAIFSLQKIKTHFLGGKFLHKYLFMTINTIAVAVLNIMLLKNNGFSKLRRRENVAISKMYSKS